MKGRRCATYITYHSCTIYDCRQPKDADIGCIYSDCNLNYPINSLGKPYHMKENVQCKIDKIMQLAGTTVKVTDLKHDNPSAYVSNNSLSMSIRNKAEADIFLSELDTTIKKDTAIKAKLPCN